MTLRRLFVTALACAAALPACAALAALAKDQPAFVPVFATDFPDPFVIVHQGRFLAYATNAPRGQANVPMAESANLADWQPVRGPGGKGLRDAMPELGGWAKKGFTWAPEVIAAGGGFVLYYTARHGKSDQQCIGAATSADPRGPFIDKNAAPLVCQHDLGGTIDANPFRDADGQLYLYFKNDGNHPSARKPTQLWGQKLSADGTKLEGEAVPLLKNDQKWEAHVIEAPSMVREGKGYAMFYSANDYGWQPNQRLSAYAIGYATCTGPLGPCADAPGNPLLYSFNSREAGCLSGPGHQTVFQAAGRSFIAFHAWAAGPGCRPLEAQRYMYVAPLFWKDGKPQIAPSLRPAKK
ncbi:MAG TPA: glycoside hydrolase family 43 protein [Allosphingosinicella sp.]|jgi:beta-xylosidase